MLTQCVTNKVKNDYSNYLSFIKHLKTKPILMFESKTEGHNHNQNSYQPATSKIKLMLKFNQLCNNYISQTDFHNKGCPTIQ